MLYRATRTGSSASSNESIGWVHRVDCPRGLVETTGQGPPYVRSLPPAAGAQCVRAIPPNREQASRGCAKGTERRAHLRQWRWDSLLRANSMAQSTKTVSAATMGYAIHPKMASTAGVSAPHAHPDETPNGKANASAIVAMRLIDVWPRPHRLRLGPGWRRLPVRTQVRRGGSANRLRTRERW